MTRTLPRLRHLSAHELSWRARGLCRTAAQRVAASVRAPQWHSKDIAAVLADPALDRLPADALRQQDGMTLQSQLVDMMGRRPVRFALDPGTSGAMRDAVASRWPGAALDAAARADRLLAHHYDVLGYEDVSWSGPGGDVDWHFDPVHRRRAPLRFWASVPYLDPMLGDHKVIWELNRHQHWLRLGRALWLTRKPQYGTAIVTELEHWLAANRPLTGINWASMLEIGLRAMSWTWALHFLIGDQGSGTRDRADDPQSPIPGPRATPWLIDMLVALDRQLTHVEQNLSIYFSPNTHLTGEALGLYVVGTALPELKASSRWADTGRTILLEQIERQIHSDGGHRERSTHYHRYTLDFYLMALRTATRARDTEAASSFTNAVTRLAEFMRAIADDNGRIPLIGDDDGGMLWPIAGRPCDDVRDSLAVAALLLRRADLCPWGLQEEALWIAGPDAHEGIRFDASEPPASRSLTFADTGYVVLRDASGSHATFDVGCHGYLNGGHAHADALAVTLSVDGRPLLIDPGTSTYTMDSRLRSLFRSTMSHNTVVVDGRPQAMPRGPFHWESRADAHLHGSRHNEGFDWAEASHDGYAPASHRRTIVRTRDEGWLLVDEVLGSREMNASFHWHLDPSWTPHCDAPGRLLLTHTDGAQAWLLHDAADIRLAHGDERSGLGWCAPVYGTLVPTWTVAGSRAGCAELRFITWIAPRHFEHPPRLESLDCSRGLGGGPVLAVQIARTNDRSVFLLRPGQEADDEGRGSATDDYRTDARMLHYVEQHGVSATLDLVDGGHALSQHEGWISLTCAERVSDLHVRRSHNRLELFASVPPTALRLQGEGLADVRYVELNHRQMPAVRALSANALMIDSVDWGTADDPAPALPACESA